MPYDLFWHGPLNAYFAYAQKGIDESKRKAEELHYSGWIDGRYTMDALLAVYKLFNGFAGKGSKTYQYPKLPYTEKDKPRDLGEPEKVDYTDAVREHNLRMQAMVAEKKKR